MKNETTGGLACNPAEIRLIQRFRQQPELLARFESILALTCPAEGPVKTADEVEGLLIQALRQLGSTSMNHWATQTEQRVSDELKAQDATVRSRKKKR